MAQSINIFSLILSLSFLPWTSAGFTLKLIHRDSPLSPLYQSNLTDLERFSKNVEISMARASYFQQHMKNESSNARENLSIRLPSKFLHPAFTAEISIGIPAVKRTLMFDTGSSITWTQCQPCITCFRQNEPLFEPRRSITYRALDRTHPLAKGFTCTPTGCTYYASYLSGEYSQGDAALENFTFQTNEHTPELVPNLAFGCGTNNVGRYPPEISGVLAMGRKRLSFIRQLGKTTKYRFSYCLGLNAVTSYVKFGDEALIHGRRTPFLSNDDDNHYGVHLMGLSINGLNLKLGHDPFPDGCVIDSGSSFSMLNPGAYTAVKKFLKSYFSKIKHVKKYVGHNVSDKFLCYSYPEGFASFPSMTFHFQGADYEVPGSNLFFYMEGNVFCLSMMESTGKTILGAHQQMNVRIVYDLKERMLSFAPEDCSTDA